MVGISQNCLSFIVSQWNYLHLRQIFLVSPNFGVLAEGQNQNNDKKYHYVNLGNFIHTYILSFHILEIINYYWIIANCSVIFMKNAHYYKDILHNDDKYSYDMLSQQHSKHLVMDDSRPT